MAQLTHEQYDLLERAIVDKRRIALMRRGTEYVVVPSRLSVESGREALERVERDPPPDLVLLDMLMPELDGYGVLQALQKDGKFGGENVLIVYGSSTPNVVIPEKSGEGRRGPERGIGWNDIAVRHEEQGTGASITLKACNKVEAKGIASQKFGMDALSFDGLHQVVCHASFISGRIRRVEAYKIGEESFGGLRKKS